MEKNFYALVVDSNLHDRNFVAEILRTYGWHASEAGSASEASEMSSKQKWRLVFCDEKLVADDDYAVLRDFADKQSQAHFVLMSERESASDVAGVTAYKADDYLKKPVEIDDILNIAQIVYEQHRLGAKTEKLKFERHDFTSDVHLIGKSPKFVKSLKMVGRIAATNLPVIITGESGTGKEVVARAIHQRSSRASGAFVAVNCGAIPSELIDSELFGHVRGAFTGADRERTGLWEEADGGTLFLDEITETSPLFQVKLLRALQQKEIRRVGSNQSRKIDVRVVAATNSDIEKEVREGRFRGDLMYRLNTVIIQLPLNERAEDIPLLAEYFARQIDLPEIQPIKFSAEALERLKIYDWRGNVRELENAIVHAASLCDGMIYPEHLPARIQNFERDLTLAAKRKTNVSWMTLPEMKAEYVAKVLAHTKGKKQAALNILKIDRKTLNSYIARESNGSE